MTTSLMPPRAALARDGGSPALTRPRPAEETAEARLALLRAEYARLVTAARATVAAAWAGQARPLVYLEAELRRQGGLPRPEAAVLTVLADASTAMALAGRVTEHRRPVRARPQRGRAG